MDQRDQTNQTQYRNSDPEVRVMGNGTTTAAEFSTASIVKSRKGYQCQGDSYSKSCHLGHPVLFMKSRKTAIPIRRAPTRPTTSKMCDMGNLLRGLVPESAFRQRRTPCSNEKAQAVVVTLGPFVAYCCLLTRTSLLRLRAPDIFFLISQNGFPSVGPIPMQSLGFEPLHGAVRTHAACAP